MKHELPSSELYELPDDEYKELEVLRKIVRSCYPMEIYDGEIMMNDTFFTLEKDRDSYLYLVKLIKEREEE